MKVFDVFQRPASDGLIRCSPSEVSARAAVHEEIIGIRRRTPKNKVGTTV